MVPTSFAIIDPVLSTVIDVPMMDALVMNVPEQHAGPSCHDCLVGVHDNDGVKHGDKIMGKQGSPVPWALKLGHRLKQRLKAQSESVRRFASNPKSMPDAPGKGIITGVPN